MSLVHSQFTTTSVQDSYDWHLLSIMHIEMVLNLWTFKVLYSDTVSVMMVWYLRPHEICMFYGNLSDSVHNQNMNNNTHSIYMIDIMMPLRDDVTV